MSYSYYTINKSKKLYEYKFLKDILSSNQTKLYI